MVLDFEYGVNTGNRFLQLVDHDEEPEEFIATQTKEEAKVKPATKDTKQTTKKTTSTNKPATTTITTTSAKTNKENIATKSANVEQQQQRRQQSSTVPAVFGDNNNQQVRSDSARGARGGLRRGGAPFDGASRGRSQRFNKFDGSTPSNESGSGEHGGENNRGRGLGRRGNFEGGRGGGRGRGRGGRGNFNNRNLEEGSQETGGWQQSADANFENTRSQPNREYDADVAPLERPIEPDNTRRSNRGSARGRPYHGNRESGENTEDYRANRRQTDRQPRSLVSGVKSVEKKDGEGAHNWGNPTENPEDHPLPEETTETTAPALKDWAQQVDEAEKQMTFDEYRKQIEARKRAVQEKLPQFNTRAAGEGEDPKLWQKYAQEYRKKNDDDDEEEDEDDEDENISGGENEEEQLSGKKKIITIPLRFNSNEVPRGSRGGPRRGGNRFRPNRDDQQRSTSPSQGQNSPSQQYDDQRGSRRGDRRSGRGSRQTGRSHADPNAPALDNPDDFPTLPKQ